MTKYRNARPGDRNFDEEEGGIDEMLAEFAGVHLDGTDLDSPSGFNIPDPAEAQLRRAIAEVDDERRDGSIFRTLMTRGDSNRHFYGRRREDFDAAPPLRFHDK